MTKTAGLTRVIVVCVLAALAFVVAAALLGGDPDGGRLRPLRPDGGVRDVLASAGFLFFAFAGYARIATLGEEVREPARTIPRAVVLALGITLVVYGAVAVSALAVLGPERLAASSAPLVGVVEATSVDELAPLVRVGAALAALGVLLSLLAGVSRTVFAMASDGHLPRALAAVHGERKVPHVAEIAVGATVAAIVALADLRSAIGFSSVTILVYYAIANASAFTLPRERRTWPRLVPVAGFVGCLTIALALPWTSVAAGLGLLALGAAAFAVRRAAGRRREPSP